MSTPRLAVVLVLVLAPLALAADVPVAGRRLTLRASATRPEGRGATFVLKDAAIAPPFSDPTLGAALLVSGGAGDGQCRAEIALDPGGWTPIRGDGTQRGYRYRAVAPGTQGVRRIVLKPGVLVVVARGADWPCDLAASTERLPVTAVVRIDDTRYCGAFGGTVTRNETGRFKATVAGPPAACPETDLTVANLNILHGLFCPGGTDNCRKSERIDLLFEWVAGSGCPDVVTLQEVWNASVPLIQAHLATTCPFAYNEIYFSHFPVDDQMILSRYPAVTTELVPLYKNFRSVTYARLDHPIGPVDVFSTHLASSGDGAQDPCAGDCPAECVTAGATTVRECQGVQVANLVAARHDVPTPAVATGDFNDSPGSFVHDQFTSRGWLDTYLAAGNPECNSLTGIGCTAGRVDDDLSELESTASNQVERIDYTFLVPPGSGSLCTATLDPANDADGDGTATRIFVDDPNPFAPSCGPSPDPICWPSDHEGSELDLECS